MAYENPIITKTFTYPIPNEWRSTSFSQGRTGTWTYEGPRYLTFEINIETGRESGWCLTTERELERPVAIDCYRVTLDSMASDENALIAEIANDTGNPRSLEFRNRRYWRILHRAPAGYNHTYYTDEFEPRDIYDEFNITHDPVTGKFHLPVKGWEVEGRMDVTWDDIKDLRNKMLHDTDGKISADMPQAIQDKWTTYRQLLRDLPTNLAAFPTWAAAKMFPTAPDFTPPAATDPNGLVPNREE